MPPIAWKPEHYVTAYELARSGLSDQKIAAAMNVTPLTLRKWIKTKPAFKDAVQRGRNFCKSSKGEEFRDYVYNRLPPKLKLLWEQINECEYLTNGIQRMEALLSNAGKRARQHLFLYALTTSSFNTTQACRSVNISRRTMERWIASDPDFASLMDEILQYKKDFYESALIHRCVAGDTAAIVFANKTFNRDRGYNEKVDINIQGALTVQHDVIDLDELDLPLDVQRQILEAMEAKQKEVGNDQGESE